MQFCPLGIIFSYHRQCQSKEGRASVMCAFEGTVLSQEQFSFLWQAWEHDQNSSRGWETGFLLAVDSIPSWLRLLHMQWMLTLYAGSIAQITLHTHTQYSVLQQTEHITEAHKGFSLPKFCFSCLPRAGSFPLQSYEMGLFFLLMNNK